MLRLYLHALNLASVVSMDFLIAAGQGLREQRRFAIIASQLQTLEAASASSFKKTLKVTAARTYHSRQFSKSDAPCCLHH